MISIKTNTDIEKMRISGKINYETHKYLESNIKPGITTKYLNDIADKFIRSKGGIPSFLNYEGYPASICISIDEEVVHGIPGKRMIKDNDLVSIDMGIIHQGYFSDMAVTVGVGSLDASRQKLIDVTRQALLKGIAEARPGNRLGDISSAIQKYVESKGFSVVRDFVGHGIGQALHEDPEIPNYGTPHQGALLKAGMVFAIEPMVNMGRFGIKILEDGWTAVTIDKKPSAHFEHSVAITESGPVVLTE